jgi:hypothetical protein
MSMYVQTSYTLAALVACFALCSWKLKSAELSMVVTAVVGALVAGLGFPVRLLVEGTFTYLDLALMFLTASVFMGFYSEIGAVNALVRFFVTRFHRHKWVVLLLLALVMLIPGAITGAGSVSILVAGSLVSTVLTYMGLKPERTVAFIFMMAILSAAAPPINLWAMLMAAGANMPYVGFDRVLLVPVVLVAVFTVFYLGRGAVPQPRDRILALLPPAVPGLAWWLKADAGVHARGQVINFVSNTRIPAERLPYAVNSLLPPDIAVLEAIDAPDDFHARFNAKRKTYRYTFYNDRFMDPFQRYYAYHVPMKLDIPSMKKACAAFLGTQFFPGP